jgi:hypothetical protein
MKKFKQIVSAGLIATTMTMATPTPKAEAGILLTPFLIGIALIVIGIEVGDVFAIVLDEDGNLSQASLETNLAKKYAFIDDRDVIHNLATSIRNKAMTTPPAADGKKMIRLSRQEVLDVLAPTGLPDLRPDAVEALIADLQ